MNKISSEGKTISEENPDRGKILLFHQIFSELPQEPHNFFLRIPSSQENSLPGKLYRFFLGEQKSDIRLDKEKGIIFTTGRTRGFFGKYSEKFLSHVSLVQIDTIKTIFKIFFLRDLQKRDSLFIGSFVPMTSCEYTIDLEKPDKYGFVIIQTPCARIIIDRKNTSEYGIQSFFYSASEKIEFKRTVVPTKNGKLSLKVSFDGISKTNKISGNDQKPIITPFFRTSSSQLKYPSFTQGYIKISTIALPDQAFSTTLLSEITQSAQRKLITPIGVKDLQPLGFDGPHAYTHLEKGIRYLEKTGCRATIWFDIEYLRDISYTQYLKALIHDKSWEAGIHYSKSLASLSPGDAFLLISDEYNMVSAQLSTTPKSWCSLRSRDTVFFANYLFDRYSMIWRNGETGVHSEPDVGNLDDSTWEWWNPASKAGLIYPAFTHQTDKEPAMAYSISYSKFKSWVDNYLARGISIIPFQEWWLINANTHDMLITDITETNNSLRFRVKTNGERGRINVLLPADRDLIVTDLDTDEVIVWAETPDNSIEFFVHSGHEYEIFKRSEENIPPKNHSIPDRQ
jgi:hypothetical protein